MRLFFEERAFKDLMALNEGKEEMKEELKETIGDPYIRARLREMQRQNLLRAMMSKEVPKADVVVTNPTHFAVALQYDRYTMPAPTGFSAGGISWSASGGCFDTRIGACGSIVTGLAKASWTGPRAST